MAAAADPTEGEAGEGGEEDEGRLAVEDPERVPGLEVHHGEYCYQELREEHQEEGNRKVTSWVNTNL